MSTYAEMERMTGPDALMLHMERPTVPMHTLKVVVLEPGARGPLILAESARRCGALPGAGGPVDPEGVLRARGGRTPVLGRRPALRAGQPPGRAHPSHRCSRRARRALRPTGRAAPRPLSPAVGDDPRARPHRRSAGGRGAGAPRRVRRPGCSQHLPGGDHRGAGSSGSDLAGRTGHRALARRAARTGSAGGDESRGWTAGACPRSPRVAAGDVRLRRLGRGAGRARSSARQLQPARRSCSGLRLR